MEEILGVTAEHARLRERLRALAGEHRRFGYRRLHALLRREGWRANHKLVARPYQEERLAIRRRARQKRGIGTMSGHWCPIAANQWWSMDFTEDTLASGRKFRTANLKDDCTRECPAILVDFSLPGRRVTLMLDDVARERGYPDILVVDNRPSVDGRSDLRSRRGQEAAKGRRSSPAATSRTGRTSTASGCSSSTRANRCRTVRSRALTAASATNA
jgi:transposase InsO family protein